MFFDRYSTQFLIVIITTLLLQPAWSDTITTINGSSITGKITKITSESVVVQTDFAGEITIVRLQVVHLATESPLVLKLMDGSEPVASVELTADGDLLMRNQDLYKSVPAGQLISASMPETSISGEPERHWKYSIAADINGKRGNSDEMGTMIRTEAVLIGDNELTLYASVDRGKKNGETSSDETIIGAAYVIYNGKYDRWGWFMDGEIERDRFESIDLRKTASTGISFRVFNKPDHSLELQTGIGYRHETFMDDTTDATPTLDVGLKHALTFAPWIQMTNMLSFVPSLTDFGDYLLVQDSGLNMPIGDSDLSLRIGIKNNYNEPPAAGREQLDTTYYSRLMYRFD